MNCKPGQLAMYVGEDVALQGHIVVCLHLFRPGMPAWVTEPALPLDDGEPALGVWDRCLHPIRDPGDDAADESKAWLPPVPLPTIEPHLLEVEK